MVSLVIAFARPRVRLFRDWRKPKVVKQDTMFVFDPNTVTYEELRSMGLGRATAVSIVKLRARGKVFVIPEDFALCYGINDSIYERFKPYIKIDTSFTLKVVKPHRDTVYSHTDRFTPRPCRAVLARHGGICLFAAYRFLGKERQSVYKISRHLRAHTRYGRVARLLFRKGADGRLVGAICRLSRA